MTHWVIGIDEVGRGPLAGPVGVGVALVPADFDWSLLPDVRDSKQLTEAKREAVFFAAQRLSAAAHLECAVSLISAKVIDDIGIVPAIDLAMRRSLKKTERQVCTQNAKNLKTTKNSIANSPFEWNSSEIRVLLDGGLRAPAEYSNQETIIKGDSKEKVIGLASIMAKVTRDRYMTRLASRAAYQPYSFATHKGYGTKKHREMIAVHGLSREHRRTYCKNVKLL